MEEIFELYAKMKDKKTEEKEKIFDNEFKKKSEQEKEKFLEDSLKLLKIFALLGSERSSVGLKILEIENKLKKITDAGAVSDNEEKLQDLNIKLCALDDLITLKFKEFLD